MKTHQSKPVIVLLTILLLTPAFFAAPAYAADARVYISAVSPSKSGYAVDEAVTINAKIKWDDLTANKTIEMQLWNSTDLIESLENYTIPYNVSGTLTPDGSYSPSYTPSADLTEETGSNTYYLKILGTDDLTIDSESLVILVAEDSLKISVVWQDQNNDRVVEQSEACVFTVYETWAFIETTESHSLYVDWGDGVEDLIDTISVTAGTGDDTSTETKGFPTVGEHTVVFKLKDSTGTVVASQTVKINVGDQAATTTTTTDTGSGSVINMVTANWQLIIIVLAAAAVVILYLKRDPDDSGKNPKGK